MDYQLSNQNLSQQNIPQSNATEVGKKSKIPILLTIVLMIVTALVASGVTYYWQKSKNEASIVKLNDSQSKINQLEQKLTESTNKKEVQQTVIEQPNTSNIANPDLIPGDADTHRDDGRTLITLIWKQTLEPTSVWMEYGTDPNNLNKSSAKLTKELGMGSDTYTQGYSVSVNNSELNPGTTYYYRVVATVKDKTEKSAVASFVAVK